MDGSTPSTEYLLPFPSAHFYPPAVPPSCQLTRYEKSPPSAQRTAGNTFKTAANRDPISNDIHLTVRQQPKEALIATEGKEKMRKPVDPPPIIQLQVNPAAESAKHFLQSPYLFVCASLWKVDRDEGLETNASKSLAGSLVSSLHRLKDINNKDGGFFVFGDISVRIQGTFRLRFSLFDLRKDTNEVQLLGAVTSEPFKVLPQKDFKGMEESTYLSRAFSDQGVRLRLRKEPRAMVGTKRGYGTYDGPSSNAASQNKRFREETEDRKEQFYVPPTYSTVGQYPPALNGRSGYSYPPISSSAFTFESPFTYPGPPGPTSGS